MSIRFLGFFVLAFAIGCAPAHQTPAPTLALTNVTVIDGVNRLPVVGQTVLILGDKIAAIEPAGSRKLPDTTVIHDLHGAIVLPGLINGHVHLTPNKARVKALQSMLQNGVTTVRDLGGHGGMLAGLVALEEPLPTVVFSATMFGGGFMDDPRVKRVSPPHAPGAAPWMRRIDDQTNLDDVVSAARASGAAGLKLYASLLEKQVAELTVAAHAQGLKVWSHAVLFPTGPERIVAGGVDQLVHSKGLVALVAQGVPDTFAQGTREWVPAIDFAGIDPNSPAFNALFAQMVARDVILEPALVADGDATMARHPLLPWQAAQRNWACSVTRAAAQAGVTMSAGTDGFGAPGLLLLEMQRLYECGVARIDVIRAATSVNARALGLENETGSVVAGKNADIVVVRESPLNDLGVLGQPLMVIKRGQIVIDHTAQH